MSHWAGSVIANNIRAHVQSSAGGVVLFGLGDRIRCANTLENRLEMLTQKVCR